MSSSRMGNEARRKRENNMNTLKLTAKGSDIEKLQYEATELFPVGRYGAWKKGDVTNPRWLKRQNGVDFITLTSERDMVDFEKYLARAEKLLAAEFYNMFTTGTDKNGSPMLVLSEMDASGDTNKRAIVIAPSEELALRAVAIVDHFCGETA